MASIFSVYYILHDRHCFTVLTFVCFVLSNFRLVGASGRPGGRGYPGHYLYVFSSI
jgi:hypothetical protein